MEQNKLLHKYVNQIFHTTDTKSIIVGIPSIKKHIPTINISSGMLHKKDEYTKIDKESPIFFQRLNK